jgi:hypothetical protein
VALFFRILIGYYGSSLLAARSSITILLCRMDQRLRFCISYLERRSYLSWFEFSAPYFSKMINTSSGIVFGPNQRDPSIF